MMSRRVGIRIPVRPGEGSATSGETLEKSPTPGKQRLKTVLTAASATDWQATIAFV
jgi:hypothetical protein